MKYTYHINLDERGEFYADVRDAEDDTVYEIQTEDAEYLCESFAVNVTDLQSVKKYLEHVGVLQACDVLV